MNFDYLVDSIPLSNAEEPYHKGFLNAALNGIISASGGEHLHRGGVAKSAHDYADAMIRERRNRTVFIGEDSREPKYRRIGNLQKEEEWLAQEARRKPAQALVLMKMQERSEFDMPVGEGELRATTGVTIATLHAMVRNGIIVRVPADEEGAL